jgi:hypothetical protein
MSKVFNLRVHLLDASLEYIRERGDAVVGIPLEMLGWNTFR